MEHPRKGAFPRRLLGINPGDGSMGLCRPMLRLHPHTSKLPHRYSVFDVHKPQSNKIYFCIGALRHHKHGTILFSRGAGMLVTIVLQFLVQASSQDLATSTSSSSEAGGANVFSRGVTETVASCEEFIPGHGRRMRSVHVLEITAPLICMEHKLVSTRRCVETSAALHLPCTVMYFM